MGYEDATATKLVATDCACCARPLVDAESLRLGVGPVCAKKTGFTKPVLFPDFAATRAALGDEEYAELQIDKMRPLYKDHEIARVVANRLVYRVASEQVGGRVTPRTLALAALGYRELAEKIAKRLGAVEVIDEDGMLVVKAPRSDAFIVAMQMVRGSRWVHARRARTVPATERKSLWSAIKKCFPGTIVLGAKRMAVA